MAPFLIKVEESGDIKELPYFDSKGIVTIGIGFNIDDGNANSPYLEYVLQELGINKIVSEIDPTKNANAIIADVINTVTPRVKSNNGTLQQELNKALKKHFSNLLGANPTFSITETQAKNILDKIIASKEPKLDAWLTEYNIDVTVIKG